MSDIKKDQVHIRLSTGIGKVIETQLVMVLQEGTIHTETWPSDKWAKIEIVKVERDEYYGLTLEDL